MPGPGARHEPATAAPLERGRGADGRRACSGEWQVGSATVRSWTSTDRRPPARSSSSRAATAPATTPRPTSWPGDCAPRARSYADSTWSTSCPGGSGPCCAGSTSPSCTVLPGSWGAALRCLQHDGLAARATRWMLGLLGRRLVGHVAEAQLVISTHPFASQALGEARRQHRLAPPVVTYLTDASVHRLWVHEDVDLHLAMHDTAADQARVLGGTTAVVAPSSPPAPTAFHRDGPLRGPPAGRRRWSSAAPAGSATSSAAPGTSRPQDS